MMPAPVVVGSIWEALSSMTAFDLAFLLLVLGILITMTGAFGEPNLVLVGLVISIAGVLGLLLGEYSTPIVLGGLVPTVGFVLYYIYRYVQFPRSERVEQTSSAASLVGESGTLLSAADPRGGRVKLDGTGFTSEYPCRTRSETLAEGTDVVVIDPGGGNVLTVAAADEVDATALRQGARPEPAGWRVIEDFRARVSRNDEES